jgi:hypothetical protein
VARFCAPSSGMRSEDAGWLHERLDAEVPTDRTGPASVTMTEFGHGDKMADGDVSDRSYGEQNPQNVKLYDQ